MLMVVYDLRRVENREEGNAMQPTFKLRVHTTGYGAQTLAELGLRGAQLGEGGGEVLELVV